MSQNFHICLRSGPRWLNPPPLTVSLTVKYPFFLRHALISIQNCTTSRITMFAIYFCMWRGRFCQPRCKTQRELLELLSINWCMIDVLWNTRMPDPSISSSGCTKLTEHKILHALKFYDRPIYLRKTPFPCMYVTWFLAVHVFQALSRPQM